MHFKSKIKLFSVKTLKSKKRASSNKERNGVRGRECTYRVRSDSATSSIATSVYHLDRRRNLEEEEKKKKKERKRRERKRDNSVPKYVSP